LSKPNSIKKKATKKDAKVKTEAKNKKKPKKINTNARNFQAIVRDFTPRATPTRILSPTKILLGFM